MPTLYGYQGGVPGEDMGAVQKARRTNAAKTRVLRPTIGPAATTTAGPQSWTPPTNPINDTTIPKPASPAMSAVKSGIKSVPGVISNMAGSRLVKGATRAGGVMQAGAAGLDMASNGVTMDNATNMALGGLTAVHPGAGIVANIAKQGIDYVAGKFADKVAPPDQTVGPELQKMLNGRTPEQFLMDTGRREPPPPTPPAATRGIISNAAAQPAGIVQNGPTSFSNAGAPPLSNVDISAGNQQALNALSARNTPAVAPVPQDTHGLNSDDIPANVLAARKLDRTRATLKVNGGIRNRADLNNAVLNSNAYQQVNDPQGQGLIAQKQQAEANQLGREDKAGAMQAAQAERMNQALMALSTLDDASDPGGAQRSNLIQQIRTQSGEFGPLPETPAEKNRASYIQSALKATGTLDPATMQTINAETGGGASPTVATDGNGNTVVWNGSAWVPAQ